jgi:hypothetical protein
MQGQLLFQLTKMIAALQNGLSTQCIARHIVDNTQTWHKLLLPRVIGYHSKTAKIKRGHQAIIYTRLLKGLLP